MTDLYNLRQVLALLNNALADCSKADLEGNSVMRGLVMAELGPALARLDVLGLTEKRGRK